MACIKNETHLAHYGLIRLYQQKQKQQEETIRVVHLGIDFETMNHKSTNAEDVLTI